jgi:thiazole synthase
MNTTSSDILIIGGGIVGLSIAIELKLRSSCSVTVLSRDFQGSATYAAAGMLAPHVETIHSSPLQELCVRSRWLYPEWTRKIEALSGKSCGYWPCGILAPVYSQPEETQSRQRDSQCVREWLDQQAIHLFQPGLGQEVVGGWWYPEEAQVDTRALAMSLYAAAQSLGIDIRDGIKVEAIQQQQRQVVGIQTSSSDIYCATHYVLSAGAWSSQLFPLPVRPKKGQMLSVQQPESEQGEFTLKQILDNSDVYLVPRRDRRILIGATSEDVGFTPDNTPVGIQSLLQKAIRLYPQLQNYPILESWWGFRPATPDELPILGSSPCSNLTFVTGHYRNGILLAPITSALISDLIVEQKSDPLLSHFSYERFYNSHWTKVNLIPHQTSSIKVVPLKREAYYEPPVETSPADFLTIAGKTFQSRLMLGTGKYRTVAQMQDSIIRSSCQIVTVAVRRVQNNAPGHEGLAEALDWSRLWMLPNTAGCQTAEEAVRVARLGREMAKLLGQEDNNFVKLEVIPDPKYLLPDPIGTLKAAEQLVKEGFAVLPYINADPLLAKQLEEAGCATVMPLASPIGSGQGLKNIANIEIIIENARVPVVVDAGIGTPSEAAQAMELGADAVLINSAIAFAKNPAAMAYAMKLATEAGHLAYVAGRMPIKDYASASSPLTGTITS